MLRWVAITILALSVGHPFVWAEDGPTKGERRVAERSAPVYPELARRMSLQGLVRLRATVSPDGKARLIEVVGGNPVLAKAAQDAVAKWRWAPGPQETNEVVLLNFRPK
jgi:TonB family protein